MLKIQVKCKSFHSEGKNETRDYNTPSAQELSALKEHQAQEWFKSSERRNRLM